MRSPPRFLAVHVRGIAVEGGSERLVLLLTDPGERLLLPIPLTQAEAGALAHVLKGRRAPRPTVHDLLGATVRALDAQVLRVDLRAVEAGRYHADVILLDGRGRRVRLDAGAADAVTLALRTAAPVRAARAVLESARLPAEPPAPPARLGVDASDALGRAHLMARLADLPPEEMADC